MLSFSPPPKFVGDEIAHELSLAGYKDVLVGFDSSQKTIIVEGKTSSGTIIDDNLPPGIKTAIKNIVQTHVPKPVDPGIARLEQLRDKAKNSVLTPAEASEAVAIALKQGKI